MKILADINISVKVAAGLKAIGLDAVRVDAFLPANATDAKIAALALEQKACILTRDQDFPALLAITNAVAPSIINLRHSRTDSEFLVCSWRP